MRIGSFSQVLLAAPAYLQRAATPAHPSELARHDWIALTLLRYIVSEDLRSGRLKQLLPQWRLPGGGIYLTWPGGRDAPAKVRAFVDFLRERARRDPRWLDLD